MEVYIETIEPRFRKKSSPIRKFWISKRIENQKNPFSFWYGLIMLVSISRIWCFFGLWPSSRSYKLERFVSREFFRSGPRRLSKMDESQKVVHCSKKPMQVSLNTIGIMQKGTKSFKVNSAQEACTKCFAVHVSKFEILQTTWKTKHDKSKC